MIRIATLLDLAFDVKPQRLFLLFLNPWWPQFPKGMEPFLLTEAPKSPHPGNHARMTEIFKYQQNNMNKGEAVR